MDNFLFNVLMNVLTIILDDYPASNRLKREIVHNLIFYIFHVGEFLVKIKMFIEMPFHSRVILMDNSLTTIIDI